MRLLSHAPCCPPFMLMDKVQVSGINEKTERLPEDKDRVAAGDRIY